MSYNHDSTKANSVQPRKGTIDAALSQHFNELAQQALYLYFALSNAEVTPAARPGSFPAASPFDPYLGRLLTSHLRAEFHDIEWPENWVNVTREQITNELLANLRLVSKRRTFIGTCEVCQGWEQAIAQPTAKLVEDYLAFSRACGNKPSTITAKSALLNRFAQTYPKVSDKPEPIDCFLSQFSTTGHTRHNHYKTLKHFYRWASEHRGIVNPMAKVAVPSVGRKERQFFTKEQLDAIFAGAESDRDKILLLLTTNSLLRASDVLSLRWSNIEGDTIIVNGKTGERRVPILTGVKDFLLSHRNGAKDDEFIFQGYKGKPLTYQGMRRIIKKLYSQAGILGTKTHSLRRSVATILAENGMDIDSIRKLLGHTDIKTTQAYLGQSYSSLIEKNQRYNPVIAILEKHITPGEYQISASKVHISGRLRNFSSQSKP